MDTGAGKDGYSVIGQGRIDEILSTRPEDRRQIFEEAAGIVKYKAKKIEAERKLEKTDNNLLRIKDLIAELEVQHDNLKEQADKAKQFLDCSNRAKEIEVNLMVRESEKLKEEIADIIKEKDKVGEQLNNSILEKDKVEGNLNSTRIKIEKKDLIIEKIEKNRDDISKLLNEKRSKVVLLEEKNKFYTKDIERLKKEIEELNLKLNGLKEEKETLQEISSTKEEELNINLENFNEKNSKLEELTEIINKKEKDIQTGKDKVIDLYNNITEKKSKINNILSFKENVNKRIKQIQKNIDLILDKKDEYKSLIDKYENKQNIKKDEIVEENKKLVNLKLEEKKYSEELKEVYNKINQNKVDLQGMITNFNLLKNMEEDYEGYYKGVKNLMIAYKKDRILKGKLIGIIADLIKVEEKYEKAIEVALGGSIQNVVTKSEDDAKYVINYLREKNLGRVTFLPVNAIRGKAISVNPKDRQEYKIIGLGSELIVFDSKYKNVIEYLLGRTIVVENLDDATKVAKRFNYSFRVITLKGDLINSGGSMTGGSLPKVNNLINRKHRIENIKKNINLLSKDQESLEEKKTKLISKVDSYQNIIKAQESKLQDSNIELVKIENELNKYKSELNKSDDSILKLNNEIDDLNSELEILNKDEKKQKGEIELINKNNKLLEEDLERLVMDYEKEKKVLEKVKDEVTNIRIQLNTMENMIFNNKDRLEVTSKELEETTELIEKKKKHTKDTRKSIDDLTANSSKIKDEIERLTIQEKEIGEKIRLSKKEKDSLMNDFYLIQDKLKEINKKINENEKIKNSWSIKETKYKLQLDSICQRLLEEYELTFEQSKKYRIEIDNLEMAKKELLKLKDSIKKLGTVNLNSIEEFKLVKERLDFILQQDKDLMKGKEDLEKVISNMESNMKRKFLTGFNSINEQFRLVFVKLFNGGKAELIIENEDDLLNCGIEIKVQPPGKKLQNINLLSGGEKTLTAIALLFAILNVKPTPFCILDEIDASLDDANINRYTDYLKNLSKDTQFIMITHRKGTMEIADALYGVTMEEDGISKVISVELDDKLEEVAI